MRTLICDVILGHSGERLPRRVRCEAPARDDGLRVDLLLEELLCLAQQLACKNGDGRGAIAHLLILRLGDIHEDLRGGVVEVDGLQDGGAVVGDLHLAWRAAVSGATQRCKLSGDAPPWPVDTRILSMPLGPSVVFTRSQIAMAPTKEVCRV